jgi:hypothetical protein
MKKSIVKHRNYCKKDSFVLKNVYSWVIIFRFLEQLIKLTCPKHVIFFTCILNLKSSTFKHVLVK